MAVRPIGGYDPNTGWPPDDSTGLPWQSDTALPGQFQGGGAGFGPGGFQGSPKLTAPASGPPPGTSLSIGGAPTNAAGMSPHIDPTTGQPEMLTGPGGLVEKTRGALNPFGFLGGGNPYWRGAIAGAGAIAPTPAETGEFTPAEPNFVRPDAPQGTHGLPAPTPQTYPHMPWPPSPTAAAPIGSPAPAVPPPRPTARPAAVRQQPNLGAYGRSQFIGIDRPNANPGIGGGMLGGTANAGRGQGGVQGTALDLSRLFGGGQPAVPAAAPRPPVYNQPSIRMVPPAIPIGGGAGNVMEAPTGTSRRKSSSSSQGGGY